METVAATSRRSTDQALLSALERGLDGLAQQVCAEVEPSQFFRDLLRLLVHTARADDASLWLRAADERWTRLTLSVSQVDGAAIFQTGLAGADWMQHALNAPAPQVTRFADADGEHQRIAAPVRQGGAAVGVLEALFPGTNLPASAGTLAPFCGAAAELLGDFLVQHELRQLRRERSDWRQWEQWLQTLQTTDGLQRLADVISQDGRTLTASDRVTVLQVRLGRPRVVSVSGVDLIDPRSSTVQAQERLALEALNRSSNRWYGLEDSAPPAQDLAWERLQQVAGAQAAGVLPLRRTDGAVQGVVICERFRPMTDAAAWRNRCESLQRFAAGVWSAEVERSTGVGQRLVQRCLRALAPWPRTLRRLIVAAALLGGCTALLTLGTAELVITGEGKLLPAERREIFASANGIVQEVRVQHGDQVQAGSTLLVLRDPATELEITRVLGELATVRTRLNVVQAARISGSTGAANDGVLRAQQLTGEEEELRQRLDSLTRQQTLLAAEQASWTLASPIDGQVLTWDVDPLLAGRPVQRGQVLLEVGATGADWIVEVHLRERDAGAVLEAWDRSQHNVPVEFVPVTGKRWVAHGVIQEIARVTDVNDRGEGNVRLLVAFDRRQVSDLRPGKTVLPRIRCGRKALGYVWFRDLIDAVRRAWWQWA